MTKYLIALFIFLIFLATLPLTYHLIFLRESENENVDYFVDAFNVKSSYEYDNFTTNVVKNHGTLFSLIIEEEDSGEFQITVIVSNEEATKVSGYVLEGNKLWFEHVLFFSETGDWAYQYEAWGYYYNDEDYVTVPWDFIDSLDDVSDKDIDRFIEGFK